MGDGSHMRNRLGAGQLGPLFTTPTNQLPKSQAGGEVVCKLEKGELLSRPTSRLAEPQLHSLQEEVSVSFLQGNKGQRHRRVANGESD